MCGLRFDFIFFLRIPLCMRVFFQNQLELMLKRTTVFIITRPVREAAPTIFSIMIERLLCREAYDDFDYRSYTRRRLETLLG
jgi:hypothetical protein